MMLSFLSKRSFAPLQRRRRCAHTRIDRAESDPVIGGPLFTNRIFEGKRLAEKSLTCNPGLFLFGEARFAVRAACAQDCTGDVLPSEGGRAERVIRVQRW